MGKLGYTLGRIKHMRFKAALDTVERVSLRTGMPKAVALADIDFSNTFMPRTIATF